MIDANAFKEDIIHNREIPAEVICDVLDIIDNAPTVELICPYLSDDEVKQPCLQAPCERQKGEWIKDNSGDRFCSEC